MSPVTLKIVLCVYFIHCLNIYPTIYMIALYMCIIVYIFLPCFLPFFTILPFISCWGSWRLHLEDLRLTLVLFRQPQSIRCGLPYLPPHSWFLPYPSVYLLSSLHSVWFVSNLYFLNLKTQSFHTNSVWSFSIYPNSVISYSLIQT